MNDEHICIILIVLESNISQADNIQLFKINIFELNKGYKILHVYKFTISNNDQTQMINQNFTFKNKCIVETIQLYD